MSHTVRTDRQAGRQDDDNVMRKENMHTNKSKDKLVSSYREFW